MYIPEHFQETDIQELQALVRAHPLATVVTHSSTGLNANHIPLLLPDTVEQAHALLGHVARGNPILKDIVPGGEVMAIFQGPNAYISPSWYASKQEAGKVVPTWNYAVVHVYGELRAIDDPRWVREQMEALTERYESAFGNSWKLSDAPPAFIEQRVRDTVGIELRISRLIGKYKVSQNQIVRNQRGVIAGLGASDQPGAAEMTTLMEARPPARS